MSTNHAAFASVRMNGEGPGSHTGLPDADQGLGTADRLAIVGQLAAGLAHEMNTPLGSISAHAEESMELLSASPDGRPSPERIDELRTRLRAIMRQANRCSRIASRLLQFAQPKRSIGGACRCAQVVEQVHELFARRLQARGVEIAWEVDPSLPDAPLGAAELEQLLVNLVQNSLDACAFGGAIRVQVRAATGELIVVVSDSGCGIPATIIPRIFDPFFTTKSIGHGTGLGLSVCHGIVRSVGGSIEVHSAPGHGTRVVVVLPLPAVADGR